MLRILAGDMAELVAASRRDIPRAFESDEYSHRIDRVTKEVQAKRQAITDELEQEARKEGFTLASSPAGITPVPLAEGRA